MNQQQTKKNPDTIERLKRALTRILAIYYSGSSDGNPWGAFCQYLDDFETRHDIPRLWAVIEENSGGQEKRFLWGDGLGDGDTGPLAEFKNEDVNSERDKQAVIQSMTLKIDEISYKIIWYCFEQKKETSDKCDSCTNFKQFIELLQKECFEIGRIEDKSLEDLKKCFIALLGEKTQNSVEDDPANESTLSSDPSETILGNLRDVFFDQLRKEFSGEFAALGLGPKASSTWDGDKSRVVLQIYNPFYRAFFYRNIMYFDSIEDEIVNKLKSHDLGLTSDDIKNFEQVPEPLWMLSEVSKPHKHYLIGLAYHTRQMIFKAITDDSEIAKGLLGKIGNLESVLVCFQSPLTPSRLHVMPLYCYGQPRGVCAIIQAKTEQDSCVEHDGRAHQLQEVISARISQRIEEEYERAYWNKILENSDKGRENFIFECVRYSPYLLNVVAAAIYEEGQEMPLNIFTFKNPYPSPLDDTSLKNLTKGIKQYEFDKLDEEESAFQKIKSFFNERKAFFQSDSDEVKRPQDDFFGKGNTQFIDLSKEDYNNIISLLRITRGTLLIKNYRENNRSYRIFFLVDCPITAMRFHAKAIDEKFDKLKELLDAFSTKIKNKERDKKIQELAHLEGVEPRLKAILSTVSVLRDQALEVQGKLFPGKMGIMNFRSDLKPLFRNSGLIHFWIERDGQPCKDIDEHDPLCLWKVVSELEKNASLNLDIKFSEGTLPLNAREAKVFSVRPFHNIEDNAFLESWEFYVPFFYCFGHRKGIPILKRIAEESIYYKHYNFCEVSNSKIDWTFSNLSEEDKIKDRSLFDFLLKEIVHRPFNPYSTVGDPRDGILSCGLLLSIALEAAEMRRFSKKKDILNVLFIINKNGQIVSQKPIKSVQDLLGLERINEDCELKDVIPKQLLWKSGAILNKFVPSHFLSPLYQLLAVELSSTGGKDEKLCCAESFELTICLNAELRPEACNVKIKCINPLYKEYIREEIQAEESGLSSCMLRIAKCLNQISPQFSKTQPSDNQKQESYPFQIYNWIEENTPKSQIIFTFPPGESLPEGMTL